MLCFSQSSGVSSSHVQMWELDHREGCVLKNWCFQTMVLEKTLETSLDSKKIKPVNPKVNQPWIFIGRTDAKAEAQYFSHLMQRASSLAKTLRLWKIEGRRRRGQQSMRFWGWMASLTQWTWVWASSRGWWWTGKPGVLQSMGSQRVGHDWATELMVFPVVMYGWMWELDHKEGWVPKSWCFQTMVLEKTLESPLNSQS